MGESPNTRERLVLTAFELFHKQGFAGTGVARILRDAEANSGSLYYDFPTKEDLLIAVLEWCKANPWPEIIQPVFDRISDPLERVFGVLDGYRKMLVMTDCSQGCPIGSLPLNWRIHTLGCVGCWRTTSRGGVRPLKGLCVMRRGDCPSMLIRKRSRFLY